MAHPHAMNYFSTRGGAERLSFEEAVMTGLAKDGGLYIPAHLPRLPIDWQTTWADLSYQQLALQVLRLFIDQDEIPTEDLQQLVDRSYSTFRDPELAPLVRVGDNEYILELFHGPTYAFKDVALQFLGNLFEYFLSRRNANKAPDAHDRERITVVGATSGDTGSAAIYGLRGKKDVSIFILHPKGRVSPIQEAQMTTVKDENVYNLAVKGTFDDCQDIVKTLFADTDFNNTYHLGAVNSINWARILAQITYYFSSYFALLKKLSSDTTSTASLKVQYTVPTGNFGDILAGFYAKRLGLPMEPLVIATNANDILVRFFKTGRYEKADSSSSNVEETSQTEKTNGATDGGQADASSGGVKETLSPAMDILVSSNFERLLWFLAFENLSYSAHIDEHRGDVDGGARVRIEKSGEIVKEWMNQLKTKGSFEVSHQVLQAAKREFTAERVSDEETREIIRLYYRGDNAYAGSYVADPHTAIGLAAAQRVQKDNLTQIVLSTAHPAKFAEAVESSLKEYAAFDFSKDVLPEEFRGLLAMERRVIDVSGPEPEKTKKIIEEHVGHLFGNVPGQKAPPVTEQTASV